jgi:hypothetical protein
MYGAVDEAGALKPEWMVLDPALRVFGGAPLAQGPALLQRLAALGDPDRHAGVQLHAPVLIAPRIFEPEFCRQLIAIYRDGAPERSGVMRERDGKTWACWTTSRAGAT